MKAHLPPTCQKDAIQGLAEFADNEYHMSAMTRDQKRKQRGLRRIRDVIGELDKLKESVVCPACLQDISLQSGLQKSAAEDLHLQSYSILGMQ